MILFFRIIYISLHLPKNEEMNAESLIDLYNAMDNRNLFKIDYSYLPYLKISKSISYEENANKIFNLAGILNLIIYI